MQLFIFNNNFKSTFSNSNKKQKINEQCVTNKRAITGEKRGGQHQIPCPSFTIQLFVHAVWYVSWYTWIEKKKFYVRCAMDMAMKKNLL